jgi:hypothetical protein
MQPKHNLTYEYFDIKAYVRSLIYSVALCHLKSLLLTLTHFNVVIFSDLLLSTVIQNVFDHTVAHGGADSMDSGFIFHF